MNFGELQDRVYQVLGDSRSSPREFPLARIRSLLNEGVQVFRQRAEDRWTRSQQSVTAGTGVYTYPDSIVRAIAIFYEDRLIPPATVMELSSENDRWRTETGRPRRFTADDVDWNQWRYFPIPDETTSESIVMNQNSGIVGAWQDPDGSYATFNQESGIIGYVSSATLSPEAGIVGGAVVSDVVQTTVWGVESPATMTGDGDAVPLKLPHQRAPVWYALAETYSEEGDHHEPVLAEYYKIRFDNEVRQASETQLMAHASVVMGGSRPYPDRDGLSQLPSSVVIEGVPTTVRWPADSFLD